MSFLFPAFLLGALAIAVPIALHLLRRDVAPEVPFTAVRLLQRSPIARSRKRRLRDLLLLAARVAALLLLAAAFARPYIAGARGAAELRIVAIDRSYSMGGPNRFDRAAQLAREAIDEAPLGARVALVAFDDRADLLAPPGSAAQARAALDGVRPGFGATGYAALLARAAEIAGAAPARLVIVSDAQRSGWEGDRRAVVPASLELDLRDAGAPPPNVAVADVRPEADRVVVTIRRAGPRRSGDVTITRDGRRVAGAAYTAGPDAAVDVSIPYRTPRGGTIAVSVDDPDGLEADDTRYVVLDRTLTRVIVVTATGAADSAFYLTRALDAAADRPDAGFEVRTISGAGLGAMTGDELSRGPAVVLLSTRGLDRRAREHLRAIVEQGGGVFVAAGPDVEPSVLSTVFGWTPALTGAGQAEAGAVLAATDLRHPIFRPFGSLAANLGQVRFDRAVRVRSDGWDVAARFTDGSPALLERTAGQGRVVLFASDLERRWNDFPLHPAFVPFAVEAVRYVAGSHETGSDYVVSRAPQGVPPEPGLHRVQPGDRVVAVNVDLRESDPARLTADQFGAMVDRVPPPAARAEARGREIEGAQGYWRYGLLLMMAALVAESVVGRA